jgi:hypothetical protein
VRRAITFAIAAFALAAAPLAMSQPASAQVSLSINVPGDVAYGYNDGYWDRDHHWHQWKNHEEATAWREHNADHYYDYRHDRDKGEGWREDNWWGHR